MKSVIPTLPEIGREAVVLIAGALVAAWIVHQLPALKNYIKGALP